jgi:hypothetical protein
MRRYGESVQVRACTSGSVFGPEQFIWRGRLYVVRAVLAHWIEGGSWWRRLGSVSATHDATKANAESNAESNARVSGERHLWRVEASAGRIDVPGVYDLSRDTASGRWHLARTLD